MNKVTAYIHLISDLVNKYVNYLVIGLMACMVVVTTLQVVFRVFFTSLSWTEEASRYLLIWSTFFAATLAYKKGGHIAITFVVNKFPLKIRKIIMVVSYLFSIFFFFMVSYFGSQMIVMQVFQISPAMGVPMKYVYLAIPISLVIMILHAVDSIFNDILRLSKEDALA